jgi:hypothetical protein
MLDQVKKNIICKTRVNFDPVQVKEHERFWWKIFLIISDFSIIRILTYLLPFLSAECRALGPLVV